MRKIKAISVHQPWASLIAAGAKQYETRSWATGYRGPLLICAGKGGPCTGAIVKLIEKEPAFQKALKPFLPPDRENPIPHDFLWRMVWGAAVAVVDLTKIIKTENCFPAQMKGALPFGDFSPGRYAWKLENIRAIVPFEVKGRQRLFEITLPDNFEELLRRKPDAHRL
jgi:hypothetical protein